MRDCANDLHIFRPLNFYMRRVSFPISNILSSMRSRTRSPTEAYSRIGDGLCTPASSKLSNGSIPTV